MAGDSIIVISQIEKTADRRIKESEKKMSDVIVLEDVTKRYGNEEVVENASMHVKEGEIYGFLGPNGAGKTTVMKLILNLAKPDYGNIRVFGEPVLPDSYTYLRYVGNLIETPCFYEKLSAGRNLRLHCEYMGIYEEGRIEQALEQVGLQGCENKIVGKFSLGMKQRLGIARALLAKPKLLLLDEPINGLDPVGIRQTRDLLVHLKEACGTTILISSHIISEIEQLADTVGVINKGRMLKEMPMEEIRREAVQYLEVHVNDVRKAAIALEERYGRLNYKIISDSGLRIYQDLPFDEISRLLVQAGVAILNMGSKNDTLEDYFFGMLGEDGE